jgi:deoxyribonuclease V
MDALPTDPRFGERPGPGSLRKAADLQRRLADRIERRDRTGRVRRIAGADVSYSRHDPRLFAAVVVVNARTLEVLETSSVVAEARFPYVPGFLSFREAPPVMEAFRGLSDWPDLLLVDGHGVAHPRGFGLACHLGILLDVPSVGVAKSVLVGDADPPGPRRGSTARLVHRERTVGRVVRTRDRVRPVYVSVGHRLSLRTAVEWVLASGRGFRVPEPTRQAHLAVNRLRAEEPASTG